MFAFVWMTSCNSNKSAYQFNEGYIFGTIYHVVYESPDGKDLKDQIEKRMHEFDFSLSTYNPQSVISRVNTNDTSVVLDPYFLKVFNKGKEVSEITDGAFDMTVAPLVNAWGFGFKNKLDPDQIPVDSLLQVVGYQKVQLIDGKIVKKDPRIMLDASAIAKGYSVDVVADLLESLQVKNYMVEIGGEIRVKGVSSKSRPWRVGIDKPIDDPTLAQREIQDILELSKGALATSGNYRNFYIKDGKKYAHTIDPKSGYPVQHSLLSSSVVAPDCMTADAYATAFMVLGVEKSIKVVEADPNLEAYFIYTDEKGEYKTFATPKMQELIQKK
jgi:thiamine biosynthesis lipoprotein